MTPQIRFLGRFGLEDGWGRHARGLSDAMSRYASLEPVDVACLPCEGLAGAWRKTRARMHRPSNGVVAIALTDLWKVWCLNGQHRIHYFVWETSRIPPRWLRDTRLVDMVWTPSSWGRDLLASAGIAPEKIRVVPEGIDPEVFSPGPPAPPGPAFRFLAVGKWEKRKGQEVLVRAFCREFRPSEPVELVLHCESAYQDRRDFRQEAATIAAEEGVGDARLVPSGRMDLREYVNLLRGCHAFVLATRAEGWGLPILEAMACGLPCIVTGYSGLTEFVHAGNAYPVRVASMQKVCDAEYFLPRHDWGVWADPDIDHLRERMRYVYEHAEEARQMGLRAAEEARTRWTWDHAAQTAMQWIRELTE